ncbi:hypothetical protein AB4383_02905 [Vibrio breoganii]|uniref:hypothetical protein n=1 Tax=Vibrio breoganii TaxID=553239 RepID=UPI000C854F7E|nr:hypothetical protein [Vibrio breoganii]PMG05642.1 hypothetical protein BCV00_12630 [Vibrio breoganii]PMI17893.1 hypothetical protein BCU49_13030 [Vibrio breoganii]
MRVRLIFVFLSVIWITACSNNPRLGIAMNLVKSEQIYNPQATQENMGVLPEGSGERAQSSIKGYNKGASENVSISSGFTVD